ncbi:GGDEF domain-containing protein [Salinispirillum sp. LH 10-3-1]|uniref:diguanylate cyclase n=1 Tax=Salinispirillum sp. LH 10-3-1 TaxID=2952525 RepID=A0AB38YH57_9GAMM
MLTPKHNDSLQAVQAGLIVSHRRSLMRLMLVLATLALSGFALLNLATGRFLLGFVELLAASAIAYSLVRFRQAKKLQLWTFGLLIPLFLIISLSIVVPDATTTSFVWVMIMPVLSYLLLGRLKGFLLAAPFMVLCGFYYVFFRFEATHGLNSIIALVNPVLCGLLILVFMHVYEHSRARAYDMLIRLAATDPLTGLDNRGRFQQRLNQCIAEATRRKDSFALVLLDIDHFKRVNDTYGHDAGDEALRYLSERLLKRLRSTDIVARLGGEEFAVILKDVDASTARQLTEELRLALDESHLSYQSHDIHLTATFGVALWPQDAQLPNQLYQVADRRLYTGKHLGRNRTIDNDDVIIAADEPMTGSSAL